MRLTEELYKELKPYERILHTAYYGMYLIGCGPEAIRAIGDVAIRAGYNNSVNTTCNACKMRLCKDVGKVYFDFKAKEEAKQMEVEQQPTEQKKTPRKANKQPKKGK